MSEEFFHISPICNRESIFKNGILPSNIRYQNHKKQFIEDGLLKKNENKMTYLWEDCDKNKKFIKDMVYCKVWIAPRTDYLINKDNHFEMDISSVKNLYHYDKMIFDIYVVTNLLEPKKNYRPWHLQFENNNKNSSNYNMDTNYEHDDKILAFSKVPLRDIKIIQQAEFEYRMNKVYIKVYPNVRY